MHRHVSNKQAYVKQFPSDYPHARLMNLPTPPNNYSCSLVMAKLALDAYGIVKPPDKEIAQAIKLIPEKGADQWPLFEGLVALGIACLADENRTIQDISREIASHKAFCIMSHQYIYSTLHEWKKVMAGHYSGMCCFDHRHVYSADPSYKAGKTRLSPEYAGELFYDIEFETGRLVSGFGIIVPIRE